MDYRFDEGKEYVWRTIVRNDRLKMYEKYLELAKQNDYNICSMVEFYETKGVGKHFILRHDVDHKTPATKKMFMVEQDFGVHSTYYFRKTTINKALMDEMIDAGFEVGFHYETLSDYAKENELNVINDEDIEICRRILKEDIQKFNKIVKQPITSIVSHGDSKNIEIGKSNNVLIEGQNYQDYGIIFEGYDKELYEKYIDVHIMDGSLRFNSGFSYRDNPIDAITSGYKNIIFLSHPNHWYKTPIQWIWNFGMLLVGKYDNHTHAEFRRILK